MTHMAVLWEVSFCFLIWVPRLRPLVLAAAVATHLGIGAFLGMWTFGLIMLVGCASFLPNDLVRRLVADLAARRVGSSGNEEHPPALMQRAMRRLAPTKAMAGARSMDDAGRG